MLWTWHRTVYATCLAATAAAWLPAQEPRPRAPRIGQIPGNEFVVIATDHSFEAPEHVDAGLVNVRLFNRGKELHHLVVIKVDRLDRVSQISEYLRDNDRNVPWMTPLGGPESVGPGGVSSAIMALEPGRYVLVCMVVSPTTRRQHFMDGMIRELSVVKPPGTTVPARLPETEISLKLFEWDFTLGGPLFAGRRTIRVENVGKFEHHVWFVRLLPGTSFEQAVSWAESSMGPTPFEPVGGTTWLEPGRSVNVTVDLIPGDYALICTLANPLSRKPHSAHGMARSLRVVN
ncbi:MAG: hypothetical protein ACT4P7_08805 [Gemmatimonadaceae bacterium]